MGVEIQVSVHLSHPSVLFASLAFLSSLLFPILEGGRRRRRGSGEGRRKGGEVG